MIDFIYLIAKKEQRVKKKNKNKRTERNIRLSFYENKQRR